MNTRIKTIAVALAAAAVSTLALQAAAQGVPFDEESGYYDSEYVAASPKKPETSHQAQENEWLDAERERGSSRSLADIPFPVPHQAAARNVRPETPHQAAENTWLTRERDQESGNTEPVPFPVPSSMQEK